MSDKLIASINSIHEINKEIKTNIYDNYKSFAGLYKSKVISSLGSNAPLSISPFVGNIGKRIQELDANFNKLIEYIDKCCNKYIALETANGGYYTIAGDTFLKIANRYGISVEDLKAANSAVCTELHKNQIITIPTKAISEIGKLLEANLKMSKLADTALENSYRVASFPLDLSSGGNLYISSEYGYRTYVNENDEEVSDYHTGIDLAFRGSSIEGTDILAVANGTVVSCGRDGTYGYDVVLGHDTNGDGKYDYYSLYAHMYSDSADLNIKTNDKIIAGQPIGTVGSTGSSTAPHLHLEIFKYELDTFGNETNNKVTEDPNKVLGLIN